MSKTRNPDALIRIEDAIKVLCRKTCHPGVFCPDSYCVEMWDEFEDVERVDAAPLKHGRWKAVKDGEDDYKRICSCCGEEAPYDEFEDVYLIYPYCPWCGAEMYGEEGDNHD